MCMSSELCNVFVDPAGTLAPVITPPSPTATSVSIIWTQPEFSLPVLDYNVSLTRVIGSSCPDSRSTVNTTATVTDTSVEFTGLQEFSTYTVTVIARFNAFGMITQTQTSMDFTTLSAGIQRHITVIPQIFIVH